MTTKPDIDDQANFEAFRAAKLAQQAERRIRKELAKARADLAKLTK